MREGANEYWCGKWKSSASVHTTNGFASDNIFLSSALTIICLLFSPAMFFLQQSLRNLIKINVNDGGVETMRWRGKRTENDFKIHVLLRRGRKGAKMKTQGHNVTYGNFVETQNSYSNDSHYSNRKSSLKF